MTTRRFAAVARQFAPAAVAAAVVTAAAVAGGALDAQAPAPPPRGASGPPEHAKVTPINHLPNPYETVRNFGTLPDGRKWGSVSAVAVDVDGKHIWAGDRCGANSCAGSDVNPIVKLDPTGKVVASFGAGLILWPHGIDVDKQGNVWVVDARSASADELKKFPNAAGKGHTVIKFSPQGKVLLTLGTPGTAGQRRRRPSPSPTTWRLPPTAASSWPRRTTISSWIRTRRPASAGSRSSAADGKFIKSFGNVRLRAGRVPRRARAGVRLEGPAVRGRSRQPPHPDLRPGRQAPRHLVSVQPHQRPGTSPPTTRSTPSTPNRTTTTTPAGARGCASAAPAPARSGTSCPSTSRSRPRAWAATGRWARA